MKKEKSALEKFDYTLKVSKRLKVIAPIVFWVCLTLGIVFLILAIRQSFGNINEIVNKLDGTKYTGEELQANYQYLIEKYGEWSIGSGGSGFQVDFINIKKAIFSGFAVTSGILSVVFFVCSGVLGKWLLPKLAKQIEADSQHDATRELLKRVDKE